MRGRDSPSALRGLDVFPLALRQGRAARHAREGRPLHDDQREDDLVDAAPQHREQDQRHEDRREGQVQIDEPHHHVSVRPPK
jgi:hypothetical protein